MTVDWGSLLTVVLVSAVATAAIVTLVSVAVLGWSTRSVQPVAAVKSAPQAAASRRAGTTLAAAALVAAIAIVLFGLWEIVS
jgi:uncharacterized iron-regulated membrane protein